MKKWHSPPGLALTFPSVCFWGYFLEVVSKYFELIYMLQEDFAESRIIVKFWSFWNFKILLNQNFQAIEHFKFN